MKKLQIIVEDKNTGLLVMDQFIWETLDELNEQVKELQGKCELIMEKGYWFCDQETLTEEEIQIIYYGDEEIISSDELTKTVD